MPGNQYMSTAEFAAFGLADSTDPALIRVASDLVDSVCQRKSVLVVEYSERTHLRGGAPVTRTTYTPLAVTEGNSTPFLSVRVRHRVRGGPNAGTLAAMIAPFGGPPEWTELDPAQVDFSAESGELWLPAGVFGLAYAEAELTYTAGHAVVPEAVKLACAQIIRNVESHPSAGVQRAKLDQLQLDYFAGSLVDEDTRRLLAPFVAVRLN